MCHITVMCKFYDILTSVWTQWTHPNILAMKAIPGHVERAATRTQAIQWTKPEPRKGTQQEPTQRGRQP